MASVAWRNLKEYYRFVGYKCRNCGFVSYPNRRSICPKCGEAPAEFEEVKLNSRGKVMAYTVQYVESELGKPPIVFAIIDLEGGQRVNGIITDATPEELKIGTAVERDLRRMVTVDDFSIYSTKFKISK
jgi:uncharacterized OB-fold protein